MDTLKRLERVATRRASVALEFKELVAAAHREGHSLRTIAQAAGVSHVRVLKILRGE